MADSGCLVTCLCCAMSMQNIMQITPKELNRLLSEQHGYDTESNLQWEILEKLTETEVIFDNADISALLYDGIYPVVRVRMYGIGSFHYVLIVGSQDDTYVCIDPLQEENVLVSLGNYGNRIYAVRWLNHSYEVKYGGIMDESVLRNITQSGQ